MTFGKFISRTCWTPCTIYYILTHPPTQGWTQKSGIFGRDLLCIFGASTLYTLETIHWFALKKSKKVLSCWTKNLCTKSANKYTTLTLCLIWKHSCHATVAMTRYIYITNCNLDTTLDTDQLSWTRYYEQTKDDFSLHFEPSLCKYFL